MGKTHKTFYIYYDEVRLENLKVYIKEKELRFLDKQNTNSIPRFRKGVQLELKTLNEEKTLVYRHFLNYLKGKRFNKSSYTAHFETQLCYTHVTRKDLEQISSPLDTAIKKNYLYGITVAQILL